MKFNDLVNGINRFMQTEFCVRLGEILVVAGAATLGYCVKGIKDRKESQKNMKTLELITEALCACATSVSTKSEPIEYAECDNSVDDDGDEPEQEEKTSE